MIQNIDDLNKPPIIDEWYMVPCIWNGDRWHPIIGPRHNDLEINFPWFHYHGDVRFIPYKDLRWHHNNPECNQYPSDVAELGNVIHSSDSLDILYRKKKCIRAMPEFPTNIAAIQTTNPIVALLEPIYVGRKALCGKCPHKGIPLDSLPRDSKDRVICPGHGLRIDMIKEEVIKR